MPGLMVATIAANPVAAIWSVRRDNRRRVLSRVPQLSDYAYEMNRTFLEWAQKDLAANPGQHNEIW